VPPPLLLLLRLGYDNYARVLCYCYSFCCYCYCYCYCCYDS